METKRTETLMDVKLSKVVPTKYNPRQFDEKSIDFIKLFNSIKIDGVQMRVLVRPANGKFELLAGRRRFECCKKLKMESIPAICSILDDKEAYDRTFLENYARKDLSVFEESKAIDFMMAKYKDEKAVASKLGMNIQNVRLRIRLQELSPVIKKALEDKVSPAHLELFARLPERSQLVVWKDIQSSYFNLDCSVNTLRIRIDQCLNNLSLAKWNLKECLNCTKRSDFSELSPLFQAEDKKGKLGRCLDKNCWKSKMNKFIKIQISQLSGEHKNLVLYIDNNQDNHSRRLELKDEFGGRDGYGLSGKPVKEGTQGAVPYFFLNGKSAGQLKWIKGEPHQKSSSNSDAAGKDTPSIRPLKERKDMLNRKRWSQVLILLQEKIDKMEDVSILGDENIRTKKLLSLLSTFGTHDNSTCFAPTEWKTYHNALDDPKHTIKLLWESIRIVLSQRINIGGTPVTQTPDAVIKEAKNVADLLKIRLDLIFTEVENTKGFGEPKSWAGLNADGTKKESK